MATKIICRMGAALFVAAACVGAPGSWAGAAEPVRGAEQAKALLINRFQQDHARLVVQAAYTRDLIESAERYLFTGPPGALQSSEIKRLAKAGDEIIQGITLLNRRYNRLYPLAFGGFFNLVEELRDLNYTGDSDLRVEAEALIADAARLASEAVSLGQQALAALRKAGLDDVRMLSYADIDALPMEKQVPVRPGPDGSVPKIIFSGGFSSYLGERNVDKDRIDQTVIHLFGYDSAHHYYVRPEWQARDAVPDFSGIYFERQSSSELAGWGYTYHLMPISAGGLHVTPRWLVEEALKADDMTIFARYREGAEPREYLRGGSLRSGLQALNHNHPLVREATMRYLDEVGKHYKDDPRVSHYKIMWEDCERGSAYTEQGRKEFRRHLRGKYRSIDALNAEWGSDYDSFDEIVQPPHPGTRPRLAATPLKCEFERFRKQSFAEWVAKCYRRLKKADPGRAIVVDTATSYGFNEVIGGVDTWAIAKNACDAFSIHGNYRIEPTMLYSIGRALGKPVYIHEYTAWNQDEGRRGYPDAAQEAAAQRNLWIRAGYGVGLFEFYGFHDTYQPGKGMIGQRNNSLDLFSDYTIMRPFAGVIPMMHQKLNKAKDIFLNTDVVEPRIGVFYPSTSMGCAVPINAVRNVCLRLNEILQDQGYHFAFIFEEAIQEGMDDLSDYDVLIAPYAIHLPGGMNEYFLDYIESGGVVISLGPIGLYDELGFEDGKLISELFPGIKVENDPGGIYRWKFINADSFRKEGTTAHPRISWLKVKSEHLIASRGKGRIYMYPDGMRFTGEMWDVLDGFAPPIAAQFPESSMHCLLREGDDGRFLLVVNKSSRDQDILSERVLLAGEYEVEDVFLPGLKLGSRIKNGMTEIPVHLRPGRAAIYRLSGNPFSYPDERQAKEALLWKLSSVAAEVPGRIAEAMPASSTYQLAAMVNEEIRSMGEVKAKMALSAKPGPGVSPAEAARLELWRNYLRLISDEASQSQDSEKIRERQAESADFQNALPSERSEKHVIAQKKTGNISIDGDRADWSGYEFHKIGDNAEFAAVYDEDALYFCIEVGDAVFFNDQEGRNIWRGDSVEIFLDVLNCKRGEFRFCDYQYVVGVNGGSYLFNPRRTQEPPELRTFSRELPDGGYVMEVRIGHQGPDMPVVEGYIIGFELRILYSDGRGNIRGDKTATWAGSSGPHQSTLSWGTLELE